MENFVVAVFADYDQARLAAQALEGAGFNPADVQLSPEAGNASTGQDGAGTAMRSDDDAPPRNQCVLSIEAGSETRRHQALDIVRDYGPLEVSQRAGRWTDDGYQSFDEPAPGSAARRAAGEGAAPAARGGHHGG